MIQIFGAFLLATSVALVCAGFALRHLLHRRWWRCSAWLAASMIPLVIFHVVASSPYLSRIVLYRSINSTDYAPGFTKKGFDSIAIGSSRAEIDRVLGPPLSSDYSGDELWLYYSTHHDWGPSRNSWHKFLVLDAKTMTLKRKIDEFDVP